MSTPAPPGGRETEGGGLRKYEVMVIVDPEADEETVGRVVERIKGILSEHQGEVGSVDQWGRRHCPSSTGYSPSPTRWCGSRSSVWKRREAELPLPEAGSPPAGGRARQGGDRSWRVITRSRSWGTSLTTPSCGTRRTVPPWPRSGSR